MKDSSSAGSFANEEKREGGCTDVGKSGKREGGKDVTAAELAAVVAVGIRVCVALYK